MQVKIKQVCFKSIFHLTFLGNMDDLSDVVTVPLENSNFVKPFRMLFKHAGKDRLWDLVKVHERYKSLQICLLTSVALFGIIYFCLFFFRKFMKFFVYSVWPSLFSILPKIN